MLLERLGERLASRRISLEMTQAELATAAGVGKRTVERMEAGGSTQLTNLIRVLRQLQLLDALFACLPDDRPSPMELLRTKGKPRQRVRHRTGHSKSEVNEEWTWADEP